MSYSYWDELEVYIGLPLDHMIGDRCNSGLFSGLKMLPGLQSLRLALPVIVALVIATAGRRIRLHRSSSMPN